MNKQLLLFCMLIFISIQGIAQNRTIDGTANNLQNSHWGAADNQLRSITSTGFEDGISTPGGVNRPNPRIISNTLFAQDTLINDVLALSDFTWVFGQFIDHDVIATPGNPAENASISINFPDAHFNPGGAFPNIEIFMFRSMEHPGTGTDPTNPRAYTNEITSWIDASNVYGSDHERANYLRTFNGGKLKTSDGNLLPFNTDTHEYDGVIDPTAPFMENENPFNEHLFIAGDSRANENVALSAFHTLFVREHNRLCDELTIANPGWDDEILYQHARKIVGAYLQSIVYDEWLPVMGVHLDAYNGYDATIDPTITNVFSAAAFRLGHTLLSGTVPRMDNLGNTIPDGDLSLLQAFFAPYELVENDGIDPIFKGMATQIQQELDCKIVDDVRNFLFGPPQAGLGGLDLASININRGRERGLPDFNTIRQDIGLTPYASFLDLTGIPEIATAMEDLYGDVNDIDPWVGMLAEDHMPDALFGPTIMKIMEDQFYALRDGDRFYFEIDEGLSEAEKDDIRNTSFRDIIMRNTGITVMQMNVFEAMSHDSICPAATPFANIEGGIQTFNGNQVEGVEIAVRLQENGLELGTVETGQNGSYVVEDLGTCDHYEVTAEKDYNYLNGVSTFDMIFIRRHILELELFDNPYKAIAADVNNDGHVSTIDLVDMRKLILSFQDTFTFNKSWRFVDANTAYADPNHPVEANLDQAEINYLSDNSAINFIGMKIGDVTGDANPEAFAGEIEDRNYPATFELRAMDRLIEAGNDYSFMIKAENFDQLAGMQFGLQFDQDAIEIQEVIPGDLTAVNATNFAMDIQKGVVNASWDTDQKAEGAIFFAVNFSALVDGQLSDFIKMNSNSTRAEAYSTALEIIGLDLIFEEEDTTTLERSFDLYQNTPNPFSAQTSIGFNLPENDEVELIIYDISGKVLYAETANFTAGFNAIQINKSDINGSGILYYQVNATFGSETMKMILVE